MRKEMEHKPAGQTPSLAEVIGTKFMAGEERGVRLDKALAHLHSEELAWALRLQTTAMRSMTVFLERQGLLQVMPVVVSPITDPLCHSVYDAKISYAGQELSLTKSMILHKQLAVSSPHVKEGIFIFSPNVRLEKEHLHGSGRHLAEFTQLDIELRKGTKDDFIDLVERMLQTVMKDIFHKHGEELALRGRALEMPPLQFARFGSKALREEHGEDFEMKESLERMTPFWIMDHKREFYDREDPERKGFYHNYDLVWPEGFGEALSGGEREWEYTVLQRKLRERGQKEEQFGPFMEAAKRGLLVPSAGGGLGVERMVRWLAGAESVGEVTPFPKLPGEPCIF